MVEKRQSPNIDTLITQALYAALEPLTSTFLPMEDVTALALAVAERQRQDYKWGEQNFPPPIWISIESEEFGEAGRESNSWNFDKSQTNKHLDKFIVEMTHVAAVALAAVASTIRQRDEGKL